MQANTLIGFFQGNNIHELELTPAQVSTAHHRGDCEEGATAVLAEVKTSTGWTIPRTEMIAGLQEYGAWTPEELAEKTDHNLQVLIVWIVAGDIAEHERISDEIRSNY
jgi:hypothetical protein